MIIIKHLEINQISAKNNPWVVDMPFNKGTKPNQTNPNRTKNNSWFHTSCHYDTQINNVGSSVHIFNWTVGHSNINSPISWGSRIHRLHLRRGVRPTSNECPGYDIGALGNVEYIFHQNTILNTILSIKKSF